MSGRHGPEEQPDDGGPLFAKKPMRFDGADYVHERDSHRLTGQILEIYALMSDGRWRTLAAIESATGAPQASVSAQLRNLRKKRFGEHTIDRRHVGGGLYEYRIHVGYDVGHEV
jgi:hypothetical protein